MRSILSELCVYILNLLFLVTNAKLVQTDMDECGGLLFDPDGFVVSDEPPSFIDGDQTTDQSRLQPLEIHYILLPGIQDMDNVWTWVETAPLIRESFRTKIKGPRLSDVRLNRKLNEQKTA